jgi:hypothetical protein
MKVNRFKRFLVVGASASMLAFASASGAYAGEDDDEAPAPAAPVPAAPAPTPSPAPTSSDGQTPVGGVQAGAGGMAFESGDGAIEALVLGGAGVLLLGAAGAGASAVRRQGVR